MNKPHTIWQKPEALRLADALEHAWFENAGPNVSVEDVQNELLRLHAENERLRQLIAYQGMDDTADLPAILKRQAT